MFFEGVEFTKGGRTRDVVAPAFESSSRMQDRKDGASKPIKADKKEKKLKKLKKVKKEKKDKKKKKKDKDDTSS